VKTLLTVAGACATMIAAAGAVALPVYQSGFESNEGFAAGAFPTNLPNWTVENPPVNVVSGSGAQASSQFVQLGSGAILDFSLTAQETSRAGKTVWVEGYFRGAGSSVTLANANYPVTEASAIVHFGQTNGIEVWDGTKAAGAEPTSLGISLVSNNWYKVTLQLDFDAKSWEIWVNNTKRNTAPLGFRDSTVNGLNGFKNLAQGGADFDGFRIVRRFLGDSNGDGALDAADLVRIIEYIANAPTADPIAMGNSNLVGSTSTIDAADLSALKALLLDIGT